MRDREFIRRVRRYARRHGLAFVHEPRRGKGSHAKVTVGTYQTVIPHGDIQKGTLASILKQLGIEREDF